MNPVHVPAWGGADLVELLTLEPLSPTKFRNRCGDRNAHDRTYGGQVLAQALMAASRTAPAGRAATAMQFLFLQGALHREAIEFDVTALQDGKRFTSRHVRGAQYGGRLIFDAQVSFAVPLMAPAHAASIEPLALLETPEDLPRLSELPAAWGVEITRALGYGLVDKPAVDFRLPAAPTGLRLSLPEPRLRFWLKTSQTLPDASVLHAGAFAYLSDWWLNFASLGGHLPELSPDKGLYVASLNHAIWWHRPFRADEWLHFDCSSPAAGDGRGLTVARVHDRRGQLVASATQECLMAPRDAA
jgi:acyl-CoA thioesterase-2